MLNEQTVDILRKMKLNAMANELTNQLNDSNTYNSDIVNIGLHFILKNVRPYAAPCSEA